MQNAMNELKLGKEDFAARLGCPWSTFRKWMGDPSRPNNFREMPITAWALVREVLEHERLKRASELDRTHALVNSIEALVE